MFKKILKIGSLTAAGYVAYKVLDNQLKNTIEVIPVDAKEIIKMYKEKGMNILLGYDNKVVHFVNEDKSIVVQARLNDGKQVFLIEYLNSNDMNGILTPVYPKDTTIYDENTIKAQESFNRFLGDTGTSIERFELLIKEIIENPNLADLSF